MVQGRYPSTVAICWEQKPSGCGLISRMVNHRAATCVPMMEQESCARTSPTLEECTAEAECAETRCPCPLPLSPRSPSASKLVAILPSFWPPCRPSAMMFLENKHRISKCPLLRPQTKDPPQLSPQQSTSPDRQTDRQFSVLPGLLSVPGGRHLDDRHLLMMEPEQAHSSSGQLQQNTTNSQEITSGAQQQHQHQQSSQQMQSPMFTFLWPMARGPMMAPGGQGGFVQATGDAGAPHAGNTWLQEGGSVQ